MGTILEVGLANASVAAGLAVVAAVVGRLSKRPALAHGLWLIVLLKLLTPPLWTVDLGRHRAGTSEPIALEWVAATDDEVGVGADVGLFEPDPAATDLVFVEEPALASSGSRAAEWLSGHWRSVVGTVWLVGSVAWLGSTAFWIVRFRRLVALATPATEAIQGEVDALATTVGLSRSPGVWMVPGAVSPMVWAMVGRARILIPMGLWTSLGESERATLLTHELAHLRRRDHWVRWVEMTATALYWWCPIVWWARCELREAEEQCCDAWVVWAWPKATKAYATVLLDTVDFLDETRHAVPLAAIGAGHVHHLKRRVTMILHGMTPRRLSISGRAAVLGLAALVLPIAPGFARDEPKRQAVVTFTESSPEPFVSFVTLEDEKDADKKAEEAKDREESRRDRSKVEAERDRAVEAARDAERYIRIQRGMPREISKEDREALEKARAEMREAEQALSKAAMRLHVLEMKANGISARNQLRYEFRTSEKGGEEAVISGPDGRKVEPKGNVRINTRYLPDPPVPPIPPVPPQVMTIPRSPARPDAARSEQDARIRSLERKLDALMDEIKEMQSRKSS